MRFMTCIHTVTMHAHAQVTRQKITERTQEKDCTALVAECQIAITAVFPATQKYGPPV